MDAGSKCKQCYGHGFIGASPALVDTAPQQCDVCEGTGVVGAVEPPVKDYSWHNKSVDQADDLMAAYTRLNGTFYQREAKKHGGWE